MIRQKKKYTVAGNQKYKTEELTFVDNPV